MADDLASDSPPPPEDSPPPGRWEKHVITPADPSAPAPVAGDRVRVHVVGTCAGRTFEDSRARGAELELRLGRGNFVRGLDLALAQMRVGERAHVLVDADAGWGVDGNRLLGVPARASLEYDVELLALTAEPELWDLDFGAKMELAQWRRARGVALYQRGHAYGAHEEFLQGQRYLSFMADLGAEDAERVQRAKVTSDLNCAATALKLGLERDALKYCAAVLAVDEANAKAHYRAAQAHAALGDILKAEAACDRLLRFNPGHADGAALRAMVKRRTEHLQRKRKRFYRRIFAAAGADARDGAGGCADGERGAADGRCAAWKLIARHASGCRGWAVSVGCAALAGAALAAALAAWRPANSLSAMLV
ncbi:hypothetical protein KFE25_001631 [Diacronema lutheri]|uniref:peptidylprolyl isomerase n=1 Tax=Diacronema lutheri TaxID=2081491 RepID=A0A8J5XAE3_DIALT|nr:hypothetical protein KFE25_001631 [Diacronema lutheri]